MEEFQTAIKTAMMIGGGVVVSAIVLMTIVKQLLHVCPPNRVLIFSGRNRRAADALQPLRAAMVPSKPCDSSSP